MEELLEISRNLELAIQKSKLARQIAETNLFQAQCMKEEIDRLLTLLRENKKCQIDWTH